MLLTDFVLLCIKEFIASIGVGVILVGAIRSIIQLVMLVLNKQQTINYIRLQFGDAVIFGLEFLVAADLVGSVIQPNYYSLGLLAILVCIRTVLSYYLSYEMSLLTPRQQHALK